MSKQIPLTTKNKGYIATMLLNDGTSVDFRFASPIPTDTGNGMRVQGKGFLGALGLTYDYAWDGTLEKGFDNMSYLRGWLEGSKNVGFFIGDGNSVKVSDVKSMEIKHFEYDVPVRNNVGYNCYA